MKVDLQRLIVVAIREHHTSLGVKSKQENEGRGEKGNTENKEA